jgi:hypothetical protein
MSECGEGFVAEIPQTVLGAASPKRADEDTEESRELTRSGFAMEQGSDGRREGKWGQTSE